jgi:hypothetical protein
MSFWNFDNAAKLKAARKEAKRRYERGEMHRSSANDSQRRKAGVPLDLPKMKPWDHAKGRVV